MTETPPAVTAFALDTGVGSTHEFTGELIGEGTSHRASHLHPASQPPAPGQRCSGCRWTETRIFFSETDDSYIVQTIGRSVLRGEEDKVKATWASEARDVIEALLLPPPRHVTRTGGSTSLELPQPSLQALAQAADNDADVRDALDTWRDDQAAVDSPTH